MATLSLRPSAAFLFVIIPLFIIVIFSGGKGEASWLFNSAGSSLQSSLIFFSRNNGTSPHSPASIRSGLSSLLSSGASVYLPGDSGFDDMNARFTDYKRPGYMAGVLVATEQDVMVTGIRYLARSGGHAQTSSPRRIQNAIVIDMRALNKTTYDPRLRRMTVGGGTLTGQLANVSYNLGIETTVGSCPCTGVLGISLGAGIGRLQGKYGYASDNMLSVKLALANGSVMRASSTENPDLFWAVRGAGHNFGIALEATFQMYPQANHGRHVVVDFEFELDKLEALFALVNKVSSPMPEDLAMFIIGREQGANGNFTINVNLVYSGPPGDAEAYVLPFTKLDPVYYHKQTATWDSLPWTTYQGLNNYLCTREGWALLPLKNLYGASVKTYDIPTMRALFNSWRDLSAKFMGEAKIHVMFQTFAQQAVRRRPDDFNAYPWRNGSDHFLLIQADYKTSQYDAEFDEWLTHWQHEWIRTSGYGRLQQYVNYGDGVKDPPEALYGYEPWRLEKLRRLKAEFDPEGWFNGYQPFVEGLGEVL